MMPLLATVILDPTTAMIGGAAIALFSTVLIQKSPDVELRRTALLGAGFGLVYGLSVAFMYFNYTDWMLVYLVDAKTISVPLTYLLFVGVLVLHGFVASLGVGALVLHRKLGVAVAVLVGIIATQLLLMALQMHAYNHVGTYAEYAAGTARELTADPRAQMGMTLSGAIAAPSGILAIVLRFLAGRKKAKAEAAALARGAATA